MKQSLIQLACQEKTADHVSATGLPTRNQWFEAKKRAKMKFSNQKLYILLLELSYIPLISIPNYSLNTNIHIFP